MDSDHKRIVIVSGGRLGPWVLEHIKPDDVLIGADRGALFLIQHGLQPDLSIGDFDSVTPDDKAIILKQSHQFKSFDAIVKDESDTELAFLYATQIVPKPREIILIGVLGTRFDHSLANVHLLHKFSSSGIDCSIIDEFNLIRLIDSPTDIHAATGYTHISLLPLTLEVTGVTLSGFAYPLHAATLTLGNSISISNRLTEDTAHISLQSGRLLVIQSKD